MRALDGHRRAEVIGDADHEVSERRFGSPTPALTVLIFPGPDSCYDRGHRGCVSQIAARIWWRSPRQSSQELFRATPAAVKDSRFQKLKMLSGQIATSRSAVSFHMLCLAGFENWNNRGMGAERVD